MYSGLLPKGLTEDDLSSDPEDESVDEKKELTGGLSGSVSRSGADDGSRLPGISTESWQVRCPVNNQLHLADERNYRPPPKVKAITLLVVSVC